MPDSPLPLLLRLQPNAAHRALWWFGIYIVAQLPLAIYAGSFMMFPFGLFAPYVAYLPGQYPGGGFSYLALNSGYIFYVIHLLLTFCLPSARAFQLLRIVLIVAVILNLAGCELMLHGH